MPARSNPAYQIAERFTSHLRKNVHDVAAISKELDAYTVFVDVKIQVG
jgi:hypothetical protein